jgi:hypothetical protein
MKTMERSNFENNTAFYRYILLESLIRAWHLSATPELCKTSFRISGIFSLNVEKVFENRYITDEEFLPKNILWQAKKYSHLFQINSRILTSSNFIEHL